MGERVGRFFSSLQIRTFGRRNLELSILPLKDIKPHEETIPELLDSLTRDLRRTELQRDPILVDKKTHVALDGMHRRAALKALGAKYAVCAEYDYLSKDVKLERWLRYFIAPDQKLLFQLFALFDLESCADYRKAARLVDTITTSLALLSAENSFVSKKKTGAFEVYSKIKKADSLCKAAKIAIEFAPESSRFELFTSESVYVLYPHVLSKKDILEVAMKNTEFPCKTTRHIVPVRPMGIFFPLSYLRSSSKIECETELERIVRLSKIGREEREVWYEGRRYSEPLAIFRREK